MDEDGYPTEEELEAIRSWEVKDIQRDFHGLFDYLKYRGLWKYAESGYWKEEIKDGKHEYHLSTAGWSGNESIILAMQQNYLWWSLFWLSSNRGGHYVFISYG